MDVRTLDMDSGSGDRSGADPDDRLATGALGRLGVIGLGWGSGVRPSRTPVLGSGMARSDNDDDGPTRATSIALHPAGPGLRADADPDGGICQW
jgi:hypothetical protein